MRMKIRKLKLHNFKTFKELDVALNDFNVIIGANASGKSNFVNIFKFLRDIKNHGMKNALSMQGGFEYLTNIGNQDDPMTLEVISECQSKRILSKKIDSDMIGIKINEVLYEFILKKANEKKISIQKDQLTCKCKFVRLIKEDGIREKEEFGNGQITYSIKNGKSQLELNLPEDVSFEKDDFIPQFFIEDIFPPNSLLLETHIPYILIPTQFDQSFADISIFDIDSKLSKKAVPITGKTELEEDGSNLAIVLKDLVEDKEKKRMFLNLVKDLLPFVKDLDTKKLPDKSLLLELKENYFPDYSLPAFMLSEGTIEIITLIIALYFEENPIIIIEEPERNIHPTLISKIIEMLKEASKNRQIIITTHNPEIVKYCELKDILLISRNTEGFSSIIKPEKNEAVLTFLENEIGIEELYLQNLLGV